MVEEKKHSLIKPSVNSPISIDFDWWKKHDNNWRVYLHSCLCDEHQEQFSDLEEELLYDLIDMQTGEISKIDGLQHILISHCAKQENFITPNTTIVDTVFRLLIINGNRPMTSNELSDKINRPAQTILRTLAGPRVYKGIRPIQQ
ncbi:MAG: hypothetical protein JEZ00_08875 [Anaerolineaceae bacterium]|nr:hypothetical protein [Anaerolineaceae bacterium]